MPLRATRAPEPSWRSSLPAPVHASWAPPGLAPERGLAWSACSGETGLAKFGPSRIEGAKTEATIWSSYDFATSAPIGVRTQATTTQARRLLDSALRPVTASTRALPPLAFARSQPEPDCHRATPVEARSASPSIGRATLGPPTATTRGVHLVPLPARPRRPSSGRLANDDLLGCCQPPTPHLSGATRPARPTTSRATRSSVIYGPGRSRSTTTQRVFATTSSRDTSAPQGCAMAAVAGVSAK